MDDSPAELMLSGAPKFEMNSAPFEPVAGFVERMEEGFSGNPMKGKTSLERGNCIRIEGDHYESYTSLNVL